MKSGIFQAVNSSNRKVGTEEYEVTETADAYLYSSIIRLNTFGTLEQHLDATWNKQWILQSARVKIPAHAITYEVIFFPRHVTYEKCIDEATVYSKVIEKTRGANYFAPIIGCLALPFLWTKNVGLHAEQTELRGIPDGYLKVVSSKEVLGEKKIQISVENGGGVDIVNIFLDTDGNLIRAISRRGVSVQRQ